MKKLISTALVITMAAALCSCGKSGEATTTAASAETTSATTETGDTTTTAEETIEVVTEDITTTSHAWIRGDYQIYKSNLESKITAPKDKDTFVYGNSAGIKAADPNTFQNEYSWSEQVYDTLIGKDIINGTEELVPELATDWGYDDDGNFNITLREGVKFHDGTTLDADDVLFTLQRVATSYVNKCASSMACIDFEKSYKTDDLHLTLVFSQPCGSLLNDLSCGYTGIMSKEYCEANPEATFLEEDAGCGAYKVIETVSGTSQKYEAFEDYWNGTPSIKYVEYKLYKDYSVMAIDFMNGDLDACFNNTYNTVNQFLNNEMPGATLYQVPSRSVYMDMTTRGEVTLADQRLRQALAYCINYDELVLAVYQDSVMANTSYGPFPTGTAYEINQGTITYDVDKAKSLLEECGYSVDNPCHLAMLSTNSPAGQAAATIIQEYGRQVGFEIEVTVVDSAGASEYTDSADVPSPYDLYICTNQFNSGSPECFLADRIMYNGSEEVSAMQGIEDEEFNELAEKAAHSTDDEERAELYAEMQELFYENFWTIQLTVSNSMVLAQSYVGEMNFTSGYHPDFATLTYNLD